MVQTTAREPIDHLEGRREGERDGKGRAAWLSARSTKGILFVTPSRVLYKQSFVPHSSKYQDKVSVEKPAYAADTRDGRSSPDAGPWIAQRLESSQTFGQWGRSCCVSRKLPAAKLWRLSAVVVNCYEVLRRCTALQSSLDLV